MPIHFEDLDVASDVAGLRSALIVPCNLCPAVTVATRENRPFMRFSRSPLKSPPFEDYLARLQSKLSERGVRVATGEFGAMMEVEIHNDGPVTLILERSP